MVINKRLSVCDCETTTTDAKLMIVPNRIDKTSGGVTAIIGLAVTIYGLAANRKD
jgi:hypothetical protein